MRRYVEPAVSLGRAVSQLDPDHPVVMLNLVRFNHTADYSAHPHLAPDGLISGGTAYQRYLEAAQPYLSMTGASIEYIGTCGSTIIGPSDEQWDAIILVRYPSAAAFVDMVREPAYRALSGHRTAALADSRLIATTEGQSDQP